MLAIRCCDQFTSSGLVVDFLNLAMISSVPPSATPPAAAWGEGQGHEGYAIGQPKVKLAQAEAEAARVRQPRHRLGEGGSFTPPLAPCHLAHTAWYSPMHAMGSIPPRVRRVLCTTSWCPMHACDVLYSLSMLSNADWFLVPMHAYDVLYSLSMLSNADWFLQSDDMCPIQDGGFIRVCSSGHPLI